MAGKTIAQHRKDICASLEQGYPAFGYFGPLGGSRWMSAAEKLVGEGVCRIVPVPAVSGGQFACIPVGTTLNQETMTIQPIKIMDKEPGLTVITGGAGNPKSIQELLGAGEEGIAGPFVLGNRPETSPEDLDALKTGEPKVRFLPPNTSD